MSYDLLIHNTRLRNHEGTISVSFQGETIAEIGTEPMEAETTIDAEGGLLTPGFVDPHTHLDKAYTAAREDGEDAESIETVISNMREAKAEFTVADVHDRAVKAIENHVRHGCTRLRTHVDVDTVGGLVPLDGVLSARETCASLADIQIVAFPQEGIYRDEGALELLEQAIEKGATVLGGIPQIERTETARQDHINKCLELAQRHSVPLDLHIDESDDPAARSLEYLAARYLESEYDKSVTASHACALAAYDNPHAASVVDLVAEAGVDIITNPLMNLIHQGGYDGYPKRRGLTRVNELAQAGVTVAAGHDNISDGFYPYGRGDMRQVATIAAHALHLTEPSERQFAFDLVTSEAASVTNVDSEITTGVVATCNLYPPSITSVSDVLRTSLAPRTVFHEGNIVAQNTFDSVLNSQDE